VTEWFDTEDWLSTPTVLAPIDGEKPVGTETPMPSIGALVAVAEAKAARDKFLGGWSLLSENQKVFLNTWRECGFNARKAMRVLSNTAHSVSKTTTMNWQDNSEYEYVRTMLRAASVTEILNKDYLTVRHEDIVETLLTPKPILHQGVATGHYEVEAGAAGKANEVLLRMGGHLKEDKQEINVGLVGPSLVIQVVQPTGQVIDVTPKHVSVNLPAPADGA
jgi:hypothetical protein